MTLKEYFQKDGSKKAWINSVELLPEEVTLIRGIGRGFVGVDLHVFNTTYIVKAGDNTLYTIDDQGNPKKPSVFCLKYPVDDPRYNK